MAAKDAQEALARVIELCCNLHRLNPVGIDIYAADIAGQRQGTRLIHWKPVAME